MVNIAVKGYRGNHRLILYSNQNVKAKSPLLKLIRTPQNNHMLGFGSILLWKAPSCVRGEGCHGIVGPNCQVKPTDKNQVEYVEAAKNIEKGDILRLSTPSENFCMCDTQGMVEEHGNTSNSLNPVNPFQLPGEPYGSINPPLQEPNFTELENFLRDIGVNF